jgi:hypothetical protein
MFRSIHRRLLVLVLAICVTGVWCYSGVLLRPTGEVYAAHDPRYTLYVVMVSLGILSGGAGLLVAILSRPDSSVRGRKDTRPR